MIVLFQATLSNAFPSKNIFVLQIQISQKVNIFVLQIQISQKVVSRGPIDNKSLH